MSSWQMTARMMEALRYVTVQADLKPDLCHGEVDHFKLVSVPLFNAGLSGSEKEMTQSLHETVSIEHAGDPL